MENMKNLLLKAYQEKYAVPHFNINNLEWTRYILEQSQIDQSPVILGISEGAVKYIGGYKTVSAIVKSLIEDLQITVPVVLHLDHGKSVENCKRAIDAGFSSVMIDASHYSLEENISITKGVVLYAHDKNVTVEAEIGQITDNGISNEEMYARVEDALQLVRQTEVDALAPALGSVHGIYHGEAKLDFERMSKMHNLLQIPLVLHGGTGIPDEQIKKCIQNGVCKININTELQIVWSSAVRELLKENNSVYDPRKIIGAGEKAMKEAIHQKILLLGSNQKA